MALKELATDLLVIGAGNAALVAAETAYDAGLKVTVLERAPKQRRGGNSAFSYSRETRRVLPTGLQR